MRQAVPPSSVDRLVDFLWQFDEKDPSDPSTWYAPQRREHNMLEVYHHQYLSDDRQDQRIYDASSTSGIVDRQNPSQCHGLAGKAELFVRSCPRDR